MPTYMYKAMTKQGQIVKNRITDSNKINCIKRLKRNDLIPISIEQTIRGVRKSKKKPRNFRQVNNEFKKIGTQRIKDKSKTSVF